MCHYHLTTRALSSHRFVYVLTRMLTFNEFYYNRTKLCIHKHWTGHGPFIFFISMRERVEHGLGWVVIGLNKGDVLIFSSEVEVLYHEGGRAVLLYCPQGAINMKFSPLFYPYRLLSAKANEIFRQLERKKIVLTNYWMREHFCTTPLFSLFFVEIPPMLKQPCRQTVFETFIFGKGQEFVYTVMGLDEGDVDRRTRCIIQKWTTEFRIPLGWWYRHVNESNHPTRFVILELH